jgi:hypothetical protein
MNDLDSRIRAFVGELLDSAPSAPPFPEVATAASQRPRPPRRRLVLAVIGGVILLGAALVVFANQHHAARVQINQGPTTTADGDALSFREVLNILPYRGQASSSSSPGGVASGTTSCEGGALVTPRSKQAPGAKVVLPDRKKTACYLLGPTLLTGHNIGTADAVSDTTTSAWIINVHFTNNDFVTKIAVPYVTKQIAIVLNGIVESAPTVNPGITGQDVTISGEYDEATAKRVAASIAPPSPHNSDTTNTTDARTAAGEGGAQCRSSELRIEEGTSLPTASGRTNVVITIVNVGTQACAMFGYPQYSLLNRSSRTLPFVYRHSGGMFVTRATPTSVRISPGASAFAAFEKYRCDLGDKDVVDSTRIAPPDNTQPTTLRVTASLGYCGPNDPGDIVYLTPVEPTERALLGGP